MNATRWTLKRQLEETGLAVTCWSGGRTKWNRTRLSIPKTHALDAACCGPTSSLDSWDITTLAIRATGRGSYCRTRLDRFGFPRGYLMRSKSAFGFATGDLVKAIVPAGLKAGRHIGRVAIRAIGKFNIDTTTGLIQSISHRHCIILQRGDGYRYSFSQPTQKTESKDV